MRASGPLRRVRPIPPRRGGVTLRAFANERLDGQDRERAVVVLGDLNDEPTAATTQILLGPPGSEIGTPGFDRPDQGDGARLWNLAPLIPAERRFSRVFRGRGELIDHTLVSHAVLNGNVTADPTRRRARASRARGEQRSVMDWCL
jgi:predicted extracellular nuclease